MSHNVPTEITLINKIAVHLAYLPTEEAVAEVAVRWRAAHRYTALGRRLYNMLVSLYAHANRAR